MVRIVQLSYHTSPLASLGGRVSGGMNVYVLELSRELARLGYDVDILTRRDDDGPAVQTVAPGCRLLRIDAGPPVEVDKEMLPRYHADFLRGATRVIESRPPMPTVIHSHYWQSARIGVQLARTFDVPHAVMFHTLGEVKNRARISESEPRLRIHHERLAVRRADAIVTASEHERALLELYYDADPAKLSTIPCGINLNLFRPGDRGAARQALDIPQDVPVLLWVGRLEKLKGVDILIQALAEVETPGARLVIVGGDDQATGLKNELIAQAQAAGIAGRVRFDGAVPHDALPAYYQAADVCVIPSYYESFGLVAIESMACGTPVVASRVGGLVSTVTDGVNGYLIPWRCPGPFAEKLDVLLANPELRANFSRAGRASVGRFSWSSVAISVAALYDRLSRQRRVTTYDTAPFGKEAFESALLAGGSA